MAQTVDLAYAIGLPPRDAIAYLAGKGYQVGFSWTDVWQEAQAKSFTAAGVMKVDVLADLRQGLLDAQKAGLTRADYIDRLKPLLQKKGWWGKDAQTDPATGEMTGKGLTPRRLGTIFDTNMQSAYMAGRYKSFVGNVADRPYWMYVAIMDRRTRPAHAALNGRTFRHDDPIWGSIWPPNGFRCRCSVRALSADNLKSRNIDLSSSRGKLSEIEVETSRRPGAPLAKVTRFEYAPGKYFHPDPGWNYNPGRAWGERIGAVGPARRGWDVNAFVPDCSWSNGTVEFAQGGCIKPIKGKTYLDYKRPCLADVPRTLRQTAPPLLPIAMDRAAALAQLSAAVGVSAVTPLRVMQTPVEKLVIDYGWLPHMVEKTDAARERFGNFILPTLEQPFEVWMVEYKDGFRRRYIGLFETIGMLAIVRVNRDGSLLWNVMRAKENYLNGQRCGILLYHK